MDARANARRSETTIMQKQDWNVRSQTRIRIAATALVGAILLIGAVPAGASPIEASVGTGPDLANVALEFKDGAEFVFEVRFDESAATSGLDLMLTLQAELPSFVLTLVPFGADDFFIDGIAYDGHDNLGFGGGEDWWHYWTRESDLDPWVPSVVGASSRLLADAGWDGWVYGNATAPLPEPGTAVLLGLGLLALATAQRRERQSEGSSTAGVR
jgi:hypothetical protein